MPPRAKKSSASSSTASASSSTASGPKPFCFKNVKRNNSGGGGHGGQRRPTTTRVKKCIYQSGNNIGEETGNRLFVFNPRKGIENDVAKAKVKEHAYGKDDVSSFNRELDGFSIKVHAPKQAVRMHKAMRELEITAATLTNLDLPDAEGVTATMLEGYTYPLYKKLRPLGYKFVKGVHGKEGVKTTAGCASTATRRTQPRCKTSSRPS